MIANLLPHGRDIIVAHSSDLHIDDDHTARLHGGDGTAGLACVLGAAQAAAADVLILAGDTFDSHRVPPDLLERVAAVVAASTVRVVVLPGNHDPVAAEAVYHRPALAKLANLHVLGFTHDEAVLFPDLDLEIWGRAHRDYADMIPFETVRPRCTRWQIAVGHGHYEPRPDRSTRLRPGWLIGDAEIAATGADYVALGHWNRAATVGDGRARYSGAPEYAGTINLVRFPQQGEVIVSQLALDIAREPWALVE